MADNHKSPLRPEGEDLLQVSHFTTPNTSSSQLSVLSQAALSDPFSVPNLPRVSPFQPANTAAAASNTAPPDAISRAIRALSRRAATSPESSVSPAEFEAWKAEYESQVVEWRRQSATMRARAEAERARWEERRAYEEQQQQQAAARHTSTGDIDSIPALARAIGRPSRTESTGARLLPAAAAAPAPACAWRAASAGKTSFPFFFVRGPLHKNNTQSNRPPHAPRAHPTRPALCCGPERLADLGERVVVTHVFVSVHVVPGTLASALPRAHSRAARGGTAAPPRGGCVCDPGGV
jgi:hypothetical protein